MKEMELLQDCLEAAAKQCNSIATDIDLHKTLNIVLEELKSLREDVNKLLQNEGMIQNG